MYHAYNRVLNAHRYQIPCRLAYALTIHKSQGQTIERCVIDLGNFKNIIFTLNIT